MEVSLSKQVFVFFGMTICGVICGAIFDVFRAIRRINKPGGGVVALQDVLFWLIELFVVYMIAFRLNYARVRAFELFALIIGSCLYFMTASRYVLSFVCRLAGAVIKIAAILLRPVLYISKKLMSVLNGISSLVASLFSCAKARGRLALTKLFSLHRRKIKRQKKV